MTREEYYRAVDAVTQAQKTVDECINFKAAWTELEAARSNVHLAERALDSLVESATVEDREAIWIDAAESYHSKTI